MISNPPLDRQPDAALLARFAAVRDEGAFAELVARHGNMVLGVCFRIVRQRQDAEDAFQAVFLALAAQVRPLRRVRSLSGWLHKVAVRVSCEIVRSNRRRRKKQESLAEDWNESKEEAQTDLPAVLDEELTAIASRYREVLVLCDLEGHTRQEAARRLGLSAGTVASRLSRGRAALRRRLVQRGVTVGAGGLAATLARWGLAAPRVTAELGSDTVQRAQRFLAARGGGELITADKITTMAQGVLHTMFLTKISTTVGMFAVSAALVLGAGPLGHTLGLTGAAKAGQIFYDDFNDRSATDGTPETWRAIAPWNQGQFDASSGDFELRARLNNPRDATLISYVSEHVLTDTSIRAQVRASGTNNDFGIALLARGNPSTSDSYFAEVDVSGDLYIFRSGIGAGAILLGTVPSDLRPLAEDVVLQFDLVGSKLSLSAWRPGATMPPVPQLTVVDQSFSAGGVGLILDIPPPNGVATYRYVWVADMPIPEPSTIALSSLGAIALAAYAFRARLSRIPSPR